LPWGCRGRARLHKLRKNSRKPAALW